MIKVLHKALNVLEYVSRYPEGQSLSAIAAAIGEKPTTTSNVVQVLASRNYLERVNGKWRLGVGVYLLAGASADYDRAIRRWAEPLLRDLAQETKTSAILSVWRGHERYVLLRVADGSAVTVNREYPEAKDIYRTATGIVLLSQQKEEIIRAHIAENGTPETQRPTVEEIDEFLSLLERCRAQGYFVRKKDGIFEAAAPIRDGSDHPGTAVGIFLPRFRMESEKNLVSALLKTTNTMEALIHNSKNN